MRLRKIKLAGFKSFVDPTTILMPSNLIAVVGPNGCGKSNVIDAVRWVMGESSAKHLRGESMADVIFNGSSSRKPVGQAVVELIFENNDGRLGGEYAQYSEISIKRTVSRDGQSAYHLNGTRCRRRDITDIFLGTGLGPRSYAIIEQGTISRIIEAKPEELRVFIEEAAGISKYKERRRETENRIKHTRENLDRLSDLRDELQKQITHLKRQANTAEKYKLLKVEERVTKAQLQALRWKALHEHSADTEKDISDKQTALEAALAQQRNIEAGIEKHREQHSLATDTFNEVQSRFYGVGADIGRIEQSIQHAKERTQQLQQDLAQLEKDWSEAQTHLSSDQRSVEDLQTQKQQLEPGLQQAREKQQLSTAALQQIEHSMQQWQSNWEQLNNNAAIPAKNAEVERTRIQHLDQQSIQSSKQLESIQQELTEHSPDNLQNDISTFENNINQEENNISLHQEKMQQQHDTIISIRDSIQTLNNDLDITRSELQDLRGRKASLVALQQAALGKQQGAVTDWLQTHQLDQQPRLAEQMEVSPGWEQALECVLGHNLQAVCVEQLDPLSEIVGDLTKGSVTLIDKTAHTQNNMSDGTLLSSKVKSDWSLQILLDGVYCVETLSEALQKRPQLAAHESIVTKDGLWVALGYLRVVRDDDAKAGVLQREHELKLLKDSADSISSKIEELEQIQGNKTQQLRSIEIQRETDQATLNQLTRKLAEQQAEYKALTGRSDQIKARHEKLINDAEQTQQLLANNEKDTSVARDKLQFALDEASGIEQQRQAELQKRDEISSQLESIRKQASDDRDIVTDLNVKFEKVQTELASTTQSLERMDKQLAQLTQRRSELNDALSQGSEPIDTMANDLQQLLEKRIGIETELSEVRNRVEKLDHDMRELEKQRHLAEEKVQEIRSLLEQVRISWQEAKVRLQTFDEQITESGFILKQLLDEMPEQADEQKWHENTEALERKISRLGPINLAAIDEFEQQSERKEYLDKQDKDLVEALETLEGAIHKIDKETRTRFKETFDNINSGVQQFFPKLFGGGHAYLELTGDDLLSTGVTVMARPPGKKNSTIHLLSGGEKALTAVALVYSIFQLNPAPFCMLDEVDAPLDDANVGRYCDLIKTMSDKTQFIFITHNKITMEIAEHLTGVTMNEPGVSHLVAVDMDQAVKLAAV